MCNRTDRARPLGTIAGLHTVVKSTSVRIRTFGLALSVMVSGQDTETFGEKVCFGTLV